MYTRYGVQGRKVVPNDDQNVETTSVFALAMFSEYPLSYAELLGNQHYIAASLPAALAAIAAVVVAMLGKPRVR